MLMHFLHPQFPRLNLPPLGDRVLGHAALLRREEAVRAHHALPHLGGPEGRGLCPRDGAPRGGPRGAQEGPALGAPGQEPHPGQRPPGLRNGFT